MITCLTQQRTASRTILDVEGQHCDNVCSLVNTHSQGTGHASFGHFAKVAVPFTKGVQQISGVVPAVAAAMAAKAAQSSFEQSEKTGAAMSTPAAPATPTPVPETPHSPSQTAANIRSQDEQPSISYLLTHRPAALVSLIPQGAVLFTAGAVAGAIGKTFTAPLDRVKILLQVGGGRYSGELASAAASGNLLRSFVAIARQDGILGYWKGNLPQVLRVLPYSAMQLYSYEIFKHWFADSDGKLSVPARLTAGACAGMASTLVTYPLDTLRLHMAVDPARQGMGRASVALYKAGGAASFFKGLGPALLGIAPYMALELAAFDLFPKDKMPSFARGFCAALLATSVCYPLDTVRRQIQLHAVSNMGFMPTLQGMIQKDGIGAVYRGFLPNALKNLPNKGIRLSTFDAAKKLIKTSDEEYQAAAAQYQLQQHVKPLVVRPVMS